MAPFLDVTCFPSYTVWGTALPVGCCVIYSLSSSLSVCMSCIVLLAVVTLVLYGNPLCMCRSYFMHCVAVFVRRRYGPRVVVVISVVLCCCLCSLVFHVCCGGTQHPKYVCFITNQHGVVSKRGQELFDRFGHKKITSVMRSKENYYIFYYRVLAQYRYVNTTYTTAHGLPQYSDIV